MAKVEIEEADLLANRQLAGTIQQMMANPQSRKLLLDAQKIVKPDVVTAKDYQDEVLAEVAKERDARLALQKQIEDDKREREANDKKNSFLTAWENQKKIVRERYPDLNDAGMTEIEKLAQERGIPDLEAAAALFRQLHPPATPDQSSGPGGWNFFEPPPESDPQAGYMKKLMDSQGDNESATHSIVRDTLAELRGQKRAA